MRCLAALALAACTQVALNQGVRVPATPGAVADLTLPSVDGGDISLAQFRGKILVVHFVDTNSLVGQYDVEQERAVRSPDVEVVEIVLDPSGASLARPWARGAGIEWPVLLATDELRGGSTVFGDVKYAPETILLDRRGRIAWGRIGGLARGVLAQAIRTL